MWIMDGRIMDYHVDYKWKDLVDYYVDYEWKDYTKAWTIGI